MVRSVDFSVHHKRVYDALCEVILDFLIEEACPIFREKQICDLSKRLLQKICDQKETKLKLTLK